MYNNCISRIEIGLDIHYYGELGSTECFLHFQLHGNVTLALYESHCNLFSVKIFLGFNFFRFELIIFI